MPVPAVAGGAGAAHFASAQGSAAVAASAGWPTRVEVWSILLATGVALAVGLASGIYPAVRASRLRAQPLVHAFCAPSTNPCLLGFCFLFSCVRMAVLSWGLLLSAAAWLLSAVVALMPFVRPVVSVLAAVGWLASF